MDDNKHKAALRMAIMGALTGGVLGGAGKFLGGASKLPEILKAAGLGAGIAGGVAGAGSLAGETILGAPEEGEESAYAKRGLTGAGLLGVLGGGALGAAGAAGKMPAALKALASKFGDDIPLDNLITRKIAEYAKKPSAAGIKKGAMIGAAAVGLPAAYEGMDEGMYFDAIQDQIRKEQRKKQIEQMMKEQYGV